MNKLSFQFHAMPDDVGDLVKGLIDDKEVFITIIGGIPLGFAAFSKNKPLVINKSIRALAFTVAPPVLSARSIDEFCSKNPSSLIFEIGHLRDHGLVESWLWAMNNDEAVMKRWTRSVKRIKDAMLTGATAVNPINGVTVSKKNYRFTAAVHSEYKKGLRLLPPAGNSLIRLPT